MQEIKLLYLLGIAPTLNGCNKCAKKTNELFLSINLGGTCCKDCIKDCGYDLDLNETKIFKYLYLIKLENIDEKFLKLIDDTNIDLSHFIDRYYEKYMDFYSKTKKVIKKIS